MLQYLAEQDSQNQQSFLEMIGAPPGAIAQYDQASQFPADVLYGAYGDIPGTALSQQGAAFGQAANNLGGIFGQQLAYNANIQAQEMAQARRMASLSSGGGGGGGGGGSDGGLTAYQQYQVARDARDFEYQMAKDQSAADLEWAKFDADQQQAQAEAQTNALVWKLAFEVAGVPLPRGALSGLVSTDGLGSVLGLIGDQQNAANDAKTNRQKRLKDMWGMLSFSGINDGLSKPQVTQKIIADIRAQYPNFNGVKEARVRARVQSFVNDNWANYRAGATPASPSASSPRGFNVVWRNSNAGSTMISAYKNYVSSLGSGSILTGPRKPSYKTAYARIMGDIRAKWEGQWNMRVKKQVARRVTTYLRKQGLRRPPRLQNRPPRGAS